MASVEGQQNTPICRRYQDLYYLPDETSAQYICESMNFKTLEWTGNVELGFTFAETYNTSRKLYKLGCDNATSCNYGTLYNCHYTNSYNKRFYYAKISCLGCRANSFISGNLCIACPPGATSPEDSTSCNCREGQYWSNGNCPPCPANTYSTVGLAQCIQCPEHSVSQSGSGVCDCGTGKFWSGGHCAACPKNTYSTEKSNLCIPCPPGTTSSAGAGMCDCGGGEYWLQGACLDCPAHTYSPPGSSNCSMCPVGSSSNMKSSKCECREGYVGPSWTKIQTGRTKIVCRVQKTPLVLLDLTSVSLVQLTLQPGTQEHILSRT